MGDPKRAIGETEDVVVRVAVVVERHRERDIYGDNGDEESSQERQEPDSCTANNFYEPPIRVQGSEADPDETKDCPWNDGVGAEVEGVGNGNSDIVYPHDFRIGVMENGVGESESLGAISSALA